MAEGMEPDVLWRTFIYMTSLQTGRDGREYIEELVKITKCQKEGEGEL